MEDFFNDHMKDLSEKAYRTNRFTFSEFLNPDEQSTLNSIRREVIAFTLNGGIEGCERLMARFGNAEDIGYEEEFPICCVKAEPLQQKFAEELTHRDILGAIMNLGIERNTIGDILIHENCAYIFVVERIASLICNDLIRIRHTSVHCIITENVPVCELFRTEERSFIVASDRLDCMIAAVYNLSRNAANSFFEAEKVFINGRKCENNSVKPMPGDIISVRGKGRFAFNGDTGSTRKGRNVISVSVYV